MCKTHGVTVERWNRTSTQRAQTLHGCKHQQTMQPMRVLSVTTALTVSALKERAE